MQVSIYPNIKETVQKNMSTVQILMVYLRYIPYQRELTKELTRSIMEVFMENVIFQFGSKESEEQSLEEGIWKKNKNRKSINTWW